MTIEKTLERLKKIHAGYEKKVLVFERQISLLQKKLDDAKTKQLQTFDAIQALEGKPSLSRMFVENFANRLQDEKQELQSESPPNTNLPTPEPGMKWIQNGEEWVLVPVNPPSPLFVSGVFSGADDLPKIDENTGFEDPSSFL